MAESEQQQQQGGQQQQQSPVQLMGRALADIRKVQNFLEMNYRTRPRPSRCSGRPGT